jgi:hypothetical protein
VDQGDEHTPNDSFVAHEAERDQRVRREVVLVQPERQHEETAEDEQGDRVGYIDLSMYKASQLKKGLTV